MNKEIKTLEDLENFCKKNTGHGMNVPPFVYTDKYFEDIEKAYGNGYRAGYKEGFDYSIGEAELEEVKKSITPQPCCDCINRQAAIDAIKKSRFLVDAMEKVIKLPSVIPQPKMGRWIPIEYDGYADGSPVWDKWECSECGYEHNGDEESLTAFCPDCGRKMEVEE